MRILFILILLLNFAGLYAQRKSSAAVDDNQIFIGERIQLFLKGVVSEGEPWYNTDTIPHFEILERAPIDTQVTADGLFLQQVLTLTSWDSGQWQIPALRLKGMATSPIIVDVGHSPMDYNQPYHDIKDIISVQPERKSNWFWYFLGIAVLIALLMLIFPPRNKREKPKAATNPFEEANLRLKSLTVEEEPRKLYTELVDIYRTYVEERTGIRSGSKTTKDLSIQLLDLKMGEERYRKLVQVLQLSDVVKFARYKPGREENKDAIETITDNINTIQRLS